MYKTCMVDVQRSGRGHTKWAWHPKNFAGAKPPLPTTTMLPIILIHHHLLSYNTSNIYYIYTSNYAQPTSLYLSLHTYTTIRIYTYICSILCTSCILTSYIKFYMIIIHMITLAHCVYIHFFLSCRCTSRHFSSTLNFNHVNNRMLYLSHIWDKAFLLFDIACCISVTPGTVLVTSEYTEVKAATLSPLISRCNIIL